MGIEELRKRRDERRARGIPPGVYPQHVGKAVAAAKPPAMATAPKRASLPVLPCAFRGDLLPAKRDGSSKRWHECEHPAKPLGAAVCSCKGCGPRCKGYTPDTGEPEPKRPA